MSQRRIVESLTQGIHGASWWGVDPYLRQHLAEHAAEAEMLGNLLVDPGFLAVADPVGLAGLLRSARLDGDAREIAGVYRRCWPRLVGRDPAERAAIIELTARQEYAMGCDESVVTKLVPPVSTGWRVAWANWRPSSLHETLEGHMDAVRSVAVRRVDGRDIVISGSDDGTVRLWDPTGVRAPTVLECPYEPVLAVGVGQVDGRDVIVAASSDEAVRLWYPAGDQIPTNLKGFTPWLRAAAVGQVGGHDVVVFCGDDTTVWLSDLTGVQAPTVLEGHISAVAAVAVGQVDGRDVVVSGSEDGTVRLWDPAGVRDLTVLKGHTGAVLAVAVGQVDGRDVVVSGSEDGTVWLWDPAGVRDPAVLEGHTGGVLAVAVGQVDGRDVVVSGDERTVRLWDSSERLLHAILVGVRVHAIAVRDGYVAVTAEPGLLTIRLGSSVMAADGGESTDAATTDA